MKRNTVTMTTRAFVRLVSFSLAGVLTLAAIAVRENDRAEATQVQLQYGYKRAVEDLSLSLDNIKTTLSKGFYSNSPTMMTQLSAKLWSEASAAKAALAQLPVEELNLEQTYKFLSQVGNYSKSLSEKFSGGEELTGDEKENLKTLYGYAENLSNKMWQVEERIENGELSFSKVNASNGAQPVSVTEGFTDFEEGFSNYPTLIYDGPFSDHILEKEPLMIKNRQEVTQEQAAEKAKQASGEVSLIISNEEGGKMPSYVFENTNTVVSVTKQGGLFSYMLKYRTVGEPSLSATQATAVAKDYMKSLGIENMTETYYELNGGMCICNFAGTQDGVVLYTDLIKIGVALDNGEILSFDARGYITNHTARNLGTPSITEEEAAEKLSGTLNIMETNLCVIPSDGLNERYCYEFLCTEPDGKQVLVYINADSGEEEQILLLQISGNGRLTV